MSRHSGLGHTIVTLWPSASSCPLYVRGRGIISIYTLLLNYSQYNKKDFFYLPYGESQTKRGRRVRALKGEKIREQKAKRGESQVIISFEGSKKNSHGVG